MANSKPTWRFLPRVLSLTLVLMMLATAMPGALMVTAQALGAINDLNLSTNNMTLYTGGGSSGQEDFNWSISYFDDGGGIINYDAATVTAASEATGIAKVVKSGANTFTVSAVNAGSTQIRVEATQIQDGYGPITVVRNVDVTVLDPDALTGLVFNQSSLQLDLYNHANDDVGFTVTKTGSPSISVDAQSNNDAIATATVNGSVVHVVAHSVGSTTVTLTATSGGTTLQTELSVSVGDSTPAVIYPDSVGFSAPEIEINLPLSGAPTTATIDYAVLPAGVTDQFGVTVSSNKPGVVSVSPDTSGTRTGTITLTGLTVGNAIVTVTTANGKSASFNVNVTMTIIEATGLTLSTNSVKMPDGAFRSVPYVITPVGYNSPSDLSVSAFSSDTLVVTAAINTTTKAVELTAEGPGTATVTVSTSNGLSQTISVEVPDGYIPATAVAFATTTIEMQIPAASDYVERDVSFLFTPSTTDDGVATIISSDTSVVTVGAPTGNSVTLTGLKAGSATITLTSNDGLPATLEVTVTKETSPITTVDPIEVVAEDPTVELFKGDSVKIFFQVSDPSVLPDADIQVSSRDGRVNAVFESIQTQSEVGDAGVWVAVQALEAGSDMVTLSVNGVEGGASVTIYDKILAKDISITPAVAEITSGESVPFAIDGLSAFSTEGYTFLWTVATPAQIVGAPGGASAEVATTETQYGDIPVTLTVTPPTGLDGQTTLAEYSLTAVIRAHREGELMLLKNIVALDTVNDLIVGEGQFIPANAFTLQCWKDGAFVPATSSAITFRSDDPSVVSVDSSGYLAPIAKGTTTITATGVDLLDPDKTPATASFTVTVTQLPTGIDAPSLLSTQTGRFLEIPAALIPANADGYLVYALTGGTGAIVDNSGIFFATQAGNFKVTISAYASFDAYTNDPTDILASKDVMVDVQDEPTWLTMNDIATVIHVGDQQTIDLTSYIAYDAITHGTVTSWGTENAAALSVSGAGVVRGEAVCENQYVYAITSKGYRLYFKFTVIDTPVTDIVINPSGDAKLLVGEIRPFTATLTPATPDDSSVEWSTSDPSIASVDDSGNVTAHKIGTTVLYAKSAYEPMASKVLTVVLKADGIMLNSTMIEGYPGDVLLLTYQILNEGAETLEVVWDFDGITDAEWVDGNLLLPASTAPGDYVITASLYGTARVGDVLEEDVLLGEDSVLLRVLQPVESVVLADVTGTELTASIKGLVGRSIVVRANILPTDAADKSLLWDVEDDQVATVEPLVPFGAYARVTYVGAGRTNVIVKSAVNDEADQIEVQVVNEVTSFSLNPSTTSIYPGESFTYDVTLVPSDSMLIDKIVYTSTVPAVAEVNENGMVVALSPGNTTITAVYSAGLNPITRKATVVVKNPVETLEFMENNAVIGAINMQVGADKDLYSMLKFTGMDDTKPVADSSVTWVVDKPNIVTVGTNGIAHAQAVGNTWVFAYAHNNVTAKIYIDVSKNAEGLTLDAYDIKIWPGETATINATILPADSTDVLEWEIAALPADIIEETNSDSRAFSFRGLTPGATKITVTTYDAQSYYGTGPKIVTWQKECSVTVKQPIESLTVDSVVPAAVGADYPKTVTATYLGQKILLVATAAPVNTTDKSVTWSSLDSSIASVNPLTGELTAVSVGTTQVYATSKSDPSVSAYINVTVVRGLLSLEVDPIEKSIYPGESFILTPKLLPEGSLLPAVKFSTSDPAVTLRTDVVSGVTLCKVTGASAGSATVTATIFEGTPDELSASCDVVVKVPLVTFAVKKDRIRMLVGDVYRYDLADDLIFNDPDDLANQPEDKTVTYTSRDESVVTIDAYGQIIAHKVGTTIIDIIPNANTNLRAQVTVDVVELAVGIMADAAEIRVYPGQKVPVNFSFMPEAIASDELEWTFFDADGQQIMTGGEDTAYFKDGCVYTVNPGFVKMVAKVEIPDDIADLYGKYPSLKLNEVTTSILVTVLQPVESVTIDSLNDEALPAELTFEVGDKFLLGATVLPVDADDPEIFWTTSDPNIASVDSFGIVSINGMGTVNVYATSKISGVQDSITLTVDRAPYIVKYGVTTTSRLFVRNAPSLQGLIYTKFKKGTRVTIVGEYGEWYEIKYSRSPTGVAYVHRYYVRIIGIAQPQTLSPGTIVTTSNATVNSKTTVWANPGSGYRTTAPAGTRVLVLGRSGSYYRISYGHYNLGVGYIAVSKVTPDPNFQYGVGTTYQYVPNNEGGYDSYIIDPGTGASTYLVGNTQYVNIPSSVTATSAPIYSGYDPATRVLIGRVYKGTGLTITSEKMNGYYQVRLSSGVVGWIEAIYLAKPAIGGVSTTVTVTVRIGRTKSKVNLRESASVSSKSLAILKKNTAVTLVSDAVTNGFYQVKTTSGKVGYILARYLKVAVITRDETVITPIYEQYGTVNCNILNVRELGSLSGVIIGTLKANQEVRIVSESGGWYYIELPDGSYGYVKSEFITLIEA